ncbi:MAG: tRNA epoxyqueuosine(34) reductase QueG [Pseudobdellovibrio sp.]
MEDLNQILNQLKQTLALDQLQIGPLKTPLTISFYEKWIASDFYADMAYLKNHLPQKKNPLLIHPDLKSVLTVTQSYFPILEPLDQLIPARIATYAQNKDYHFWLKEKLTQIILQLKGKYPNHEFLPFVDSGPILERNWAYENGMGWFGKNTCLIHPKFGSLFFIAEILTTLPADNFLNLEPLPDFCGKCRKCIDICPTQAINENHTLKADQCISYLTIEAKTNPPLELRKKMSDWFFGCDLCQTTCPWNEKIFKQKEIPKQHATNTENLLNLSATEQSELIAFFKKILTLSNKQIAKNFYGTPLFRSGGNGLKRNAMIVIGNRNIFSLRDEVLTYLKHPKLGELASWCVQQLDSST